MEENKVLESQVVPAAVEAATGEHPFNAEEVIDKRPPVLEDRTVELPVGSAAESGLDIDEDQPVQGVVKDEHAASAVVAENADLLESAEEAEKEEKAGIRKTDKPAPKERERAHKESPYKRVNNEDFDWNAYENGTEVYEQRDKKSIAEEYDRTLSNIQTGEVVEGTVIGLNKREVVVNIGYKSEGIIPISEFRYNPELAVGEKVEVYVESAEDKKGQLLLSHKKARQLKSWDRVNLALENDEIIKGYIKCRTKGGMIVDVFGIEAFLPGSQIDVKPIRDYDIYVDKTMEFKVVKINQEFRNVVVSHKALIEAELEAQKKEIMSRLEKGQILEGTVKNITSYGVFVDLGGVDGLIHITDLSWGRVNHPEEVVQLDQKINVVILDFDDAKKRIALGLKQLSPHPWDALDKELKIGDRVKGKVVVMADYGAFVEIAPGVEGLVHVSEMSWSQHLRSAQDFLKVGEEVETVILTLDRDERKMSLGIKQLTPDPWEGIEEKYPVGSVHTAKVRNFTNFGVFVELEEGIDGLIHISDLSWTKKVKHPAEFTQVGADMEVVVLEIDKESRRLSLGHKQLEENPWNDIESQFTVDSVHEGTVMEITDKGAVVSLGDNIEGFAGLRQLVKEDGTTAKVGEKLDFKVTEFSKSTKRIVLSHTRVYEDVRRTEEKSAKAEKKQAADSSRFSIKDINASLEKTTLGDISELAELKAQMEAEAKPVKKAPAKKVEKQPESEQVNEEKATAEKSVEPAAKPVSEAEPAEDSLDTAGETK